MRRLSIPESKTGLFFGDACRSHCRGTHTENLQKTPAKTFSEKIVLRCIFLCFSHFSDHSLLRASFYPVLYGSCRWICSSAHGGWGGWSPKPNAELSRMVKPPWETSVVFWPTGHHRCLWHRRSLGHIDEAIRGQAENLVRRTTRSRKNHPRLSKKGTLLPKRTMIDDASQNKLFPCMHDGSLEKLALHPLWQRRLPSDSWIYPSSVDILHIVKGNFFQKSSAHSWCQDRSLVNQCSVWHLERSLQSNWQLPYRWTIRPLLIPLTTCRSSQGNRSKKLSQGLTIRAIPSTCSWVTASWCTTMRILQATAKREKKFSTTWDKPLTKQPRTSDCKSTFGEFSDEFDVVGLIHFNWGHSRNSTPRPKLPPSSAPHRRIANYTKNTVLKKNTSSGSWLDRNVAVECRALLNASPLRFWAWGQEMLTRLTSEGDFDTIASPQKTQVLGSMPYHQLHRREFLHHDKSRSENSPHPWAWACPGAAQAVEDSQGVRPEWENRP